MKPGRLQEVTAALWLGMGIVQGVTALNYSNETIRAEATAQTYEAQGNTAQATEWSNYADSQESERTLFLRLTAIDLGIAALTGAIAAGSIRESKRREQKEAPSL